MSRGVTASASKSRVEIIPHGFLFVPAVASPPGRQLRRPSTRILKFMEGPGVGAVLVLST